MNPVIALDAMGGDVGPTVVVPGAIRALKENPDLCCILVGDSDVLTPLLNAHASKFGERISIHHASQKVEMDESPSLALRNKKDSSMRVAINLVKEGKAHACVSAGNTGALMATARYVLKTIPGVDRPAICTALPTIKGHSYVLDLGANIDCTAEHLFQFGVMGSVLASAVDSHPRPTVGLLNIGEEEIKGNEQVKEAARLLAGSDIHYVGFVEGNDIFEGTVDVVVCDGFVGNIALKTGEGVAHMVRHFMHQEFSRSVFTKLSALMALPVLNAFKKRVDKRQYNGASLLGLNGIVVKSHGGADELAFATAIRYAVVEVQKEVTQRIADQVRVLLAEGRSE